MAKKKMTSPTGSVLCPDGPAMECEAHFTRHHGDGGGLWVQPMDRCTNNWFFRYHNNGRRREMGLGALHIVDHAIAGDKPQIC
jgi:hypothetical protein